MARALAFRLAALVLLLVLVGLGVLAYRQLSGATDQDPGIGAAAAVTGAPRAAGT